MKNKAPKTGRYRWVVAIMFFTQVEVKLAMADHVIWARITPWARVRDNGSMRRLRVFLSARGSQIRLYWISVFRN